MQTAPLCTMGKLSTGTVGIYSRKATEAASAQAASLGGHGPAEKHKDSTEGPMVRAEPDQTQDFDA